MPYWLSPKVMAMITPRSLVRSSPHGASACSPQEVHAARLGLGAWLTWLPALPAVPRTACGRPPSRSRSPESSSSSTRLSAPTPTRPRWTAPGRSRRTPGSPRTSWACSASSACRHRAARRPLSRSRPPGRAERSFLALLLTWIGAGLILTYYGRRGLRASGHRAARTERANDPGLLDLAHPGAVRARGCVLFGSAVARCCWPPGGDPDGDQPVWRRPRAGLAPGAGSSPGSPWRCTCRSSSGRRRSAWRMACCSRSAACGSPWACGDRRAAEPRPVHNGQLPGLGVPAPRSAPY